MKGLKLSLLLAALFCMSLTVTAQKYGHLNAGNLMVLLPETAAADKSLETYQNQLIAQGQQKAQAWQEKYSKFVQEVQSGKLPPVDQEKIAKELDTERQEIQALEQQVVQQVNAKRQELLTPILEKVNVAIQAVGKENGYTMIFDSSVPNALLFVAETDDILPLVKAKLGI